MPLLPDHLAWSKDFLLAQRVPSRSATLWTRLTRYLTRPLSPLLEWAIRSRSAKLVSARLCWTSVVVQEWTASSPHGRSGQSGKVIGIDMSEDMIDKARQNAEVLGLTNVDFRTGEITALDLADGTVDVAISNGVFNLCVDKSRAVAEVFRVLGPGGKFFMADMTLEDHVTPEKVQLMGSWSG